MLDAARVDWNERDSAGRTLLQAVAAHSMDRRACGGVTFCSREVSTPWPDTRIERQRQILRVETRK